MTLTTVTPAPGLDEIQVDYNKVLEHLKLNPRDPKAQALVLTCRQYGLDPVLKHAQLVDGDLYVTQKGLLHVAHRSGMFDGIEVCEQGETDTHWTARVAVYRRDMTRATVYPGRYPKLRGIYEWQDGPNNKRVKTKVGEEPHPYGPEMAIKTAECMALRRAFDVALGVVEERWDLDEPAATTAVQQPQTSTAEPSTVQPAPESGVGHPEAVDTPAGGAVPGEAAAPPAGDTRVSPIELFERLCGDLEMSAQDGRDHLVTLGNDWPELKVANWQARIGKYWDADRLDEAQTALWTQFGPDGAVHTDGGAS